LTRLERARQQASSRISVGDELIGGGGSGGQSSRARSPSPPRTLSSRAASAGNYHHHQQPQQSPLIGTPGFRQPRTASEINMVPPPPSIRRLPGVAEEQQQQQQRQPRRDGRPEFGNDDDDDEVSSALSKTVTTRVRESWGGGAPSTTISSTSTSDVGGESRNTTTAATLEAMDRDGDGAVSRSEYTQHPRSVEATMAYAEYSAGTFRGSVAFHLCGSAACVAGWLLEHPWQSNSSSSSSSSSRPGLTLCARLSVRLCVPRVTHPHRNGSQPPNCQRGLGSRLGRATPGAKNALLFAMPFVYKMHLFTKTGSGQT